MASGLTFRSLIHFEFIFVYGVKKCSNLILLHVAVQFSQHHYWRDCLFSMVYPCLICCRLIGHRWVVLFLGSLFFSNLIVVSICIPLMLVVLSIFSFTCCHLRVFFGKMSVQFLCPFFNWVGFLLLLFVFVCFFDIELCEFFVYLCIFGIWNLYQIYLLQISSPFQ